MTLHRSRVLDRKSRVQRTYYCYREQHGKLCIEAKKVEGGGKLLRWDEVSGVGRWTEEQLLRNGYREQESIALSVFIVRQRERVERLKVDLREADRALLEAQALQEQGGLLSTPAAGA